MPKGYYKIKHKKPILTTTQKFKQAMDRKIKRLELKIKKLEKSHKGKKKLPKKFKMTFPQSATQQLGYRAKRRKK